MPTPAPALVTLKKQLLAAYPDMGAANIGIMADAAHIAGGTSDHIEGNAIDVPVAGGPGEGDKHLALGLALLADPRAHYLIYNRMFYHEGRAPAAYTGSSPHTAHMHLSIYPDKRATATPWTLGKEAEDVKVLIGTPGRVWRLTRGNEHLWRNDEVGINAALKEGFTLEAGYAFDLLGGIPVHSLRSPNGDTLLSIDGTEIATLTANGWVDEGSIGGAGTTGAPVYRLAHGKHLHTADKSERDALIAQGWTDEGIGFYCGEPAGSDANERIAALEARLDKVAVFARDLLAAVA
jgi:hypothetical protein